MTFVIAGGGLAAAKAAEALREQGFDGRLVLIGDEPHLPYERPPLSKDYLQGGSERDKIFVHDAAWYAEPRHRPAPGHHGDRHRPCRAPALPVPG